MLVGVYYSSLLKKSTGVLWKIWAKHPLLLSGPVWYFLLQPYFNLPFYPWFFFLLIDHSTKPLSPGEWTYWSIFGPWNYAFYFLSKNGFLKNLHYQVSVFAKLTLPSSHTPKETRIWRVWPPQELPRCPWHSVEHLVFMDSFGIVLCLHCDLAPLDKPACPLVS